MKSIKTIILANCMALTFLFISEIKAQELPPFNFRTELYGGAVGMNPFCRMPALFGASIMGFDPDKKFGVGISTTHFMEGVRFYLNKPPKMSIIRSYYSRNIHGVIGYSFLDMDSKMEVITTLGIGIFESRWHNTLNSGGPTNGIDPFIVRGFQGALKNEVNYKLTKSISLGVNASFAINLNEEVDYKPNPNAQPYTTSLLHFLAINGGFSYWF